MRQERNVTRSPPSAAASGHWRSGSAWSRSTGRPSCPPYGAGRTVPARGPRHRDGRSPAGARGRNRSDGTSGSSACLPSINVPDLLFRVRQTCDQLRFVVILSSKCGRAFAPDGTSGGHAAHPQAGRGDRTANSCRTSSPPPSAGNASSLLGSALRNAFQAPPLPYLSYSNFSFANRIILPLYERRPANSSPL